MLAIMLFSHAFRDDHELHSDNLQSTSLETIDHLADQSALHSVWLNCHKGSLYSHRLLLFTAKFSRRALSGIVMRTPRSAEARLNRIRLPPAFCLNALHVLHPFRHGR